MKNQKNLLFLTNFSEACFRAIPTVSDWIDREEGQLTILHVHGPGRTEEAEARQRMRSFFAEADRYAKCERVLFSGEPGRVVLEYCRQERPNLVFAPAGHPAGVPRVRHRSLRALLLKSAAVRIWTRGRNGNATPPRRAPENIVYVITGHSNWVQEAQFAAKMAVRHRARLHLLHLTPMQDIHDGTLASEISIGQPNVSTSELLRLIASLPVPPLVHSSTGDELRELARMLRECRADMVFLGERHAVRRGILGSYVNPDLERLDVEAICFPDSMIAAAPQSRGSEGLALLPSYIR
jgi:nucleotide-binding universal stress UspA family protein